MTFLGKKDAGDERSHATGVGLMFRAEFCAQQQLFALNARRGSDAEEQQLHKKGRPRGEGQTGGQ